MQSVPHAHPSSVCCSRVRGIDVHRMLHRQRMHPATAYGTYALWTTVVYAQPIVHRTYACSRSFVTGCPARTCRPFPHFYAPLT